MSYLILFAWDRTSFMLILLLPQPGHGLHQPQLGKVQTQPGSPAILSPTCEEGDIVKLNI